MAYDKYDNTNRGALFLKDKEEDDNPNSPDWTGSLEIKNPNGGANLEYWVSAWRNRSKEGKPYLSLRVNPKDSDKKSYSRNKPDIDDSPDTEDIPW